MNVKAIAAAAALHLFSAAPVAAQAPPVPKATANLVNITSPNGTVGIAISTDGTNVAVWHKGELIVAPSPLGLDLQGAALGPLRLVGVERVKRDRTIPLTATKARVARDRHNGAAITFAEATGAKRRLTIEARAY